MPLFDGSVKKINILDNIDRSSVCLTVVVIFALLRWWGNEKGDTSQSKAVNHFQQVDQ